MALKLKIEQPNKYHFTAWKEAMLSQLPSQNQYDLLGKYPKDKINRKVFNETLKRWRVDEKKQIWFRFFIFKGETIIGITSVMQIQRDITQSASIGYSVFNNHWGNGYGRQATELTIRHAFKSIKLHRLEAAVHPRNLRSKRILKSLKFTKDGLSRNRLFIDGEWADMEIWSLINHKFKF